MKKHLRSKRKLRLRRETLRKLQSDDLRCAAGGFPITAFPPTHYCNTEYCEDTDG